MSIELQLTDKEEYERLKKYAFYSSDRTMVLELPDECSSLISQNAKIETIDSKIFVDYKNMKWTFENITDELRYFIGDIYGGKPEYKFETITYIPALVQQGIVILGDGAKTVFKKLNKLAKISDLECINKKYKLNGKQNTFDSVLDEELIYIFSEPLTKVKYISTREAEIINAVQSKDNKGKDFLDVSMQVVEQGYPKTVTTKIYYMPRIMHNNSPLMSLMKVGNKLNALIEDKSEFGKPENLIFAGIAPISYSQKEEIIVSPNKKVKKDLGKLPVALYRIAYSEYMLRGLND